MSAAENEKRTHRRRAPIAGTLIRIALIVLVLAAGAGVAWWFQATEGASEQAAPEPEVARVVEVVTVEHASRPVRVHAMGTVRSALEAVIRPRVAGMIVAQHEAFVPGGFFAAGTWMVRIDRADYEQTLRQRKTEVERAQAALQIELGDQAVAREELELLEVDIPEINRDLILRIPQVNQARAQLEAAESAVERAELDLTRTEITAPFDGHVVSRAVTAGNNVSEGTELATFVGAEEYWVEVSVPVTSLRWIEVPRASAEIGAPSEEGSLVLVRNARVWGPGVHRVGRVAQIVGRLEAGSRLARVIVRVPDPLARSAEHGAEPEPELLLDAFVDVEIEGRTLDDCFAIPRDLIREGDTVWVMGPDDRLVSKDVRIVYHGREHVYVTEGLADGDRVIRTNLQIPVDGMLLRLPESDEEVSDG